MQLSGSTSIVDTTPPASPSSRVFKIKPHQIMAKQQLLNSDKKSSHPFLQHLPTDLSKSLESLHVSSSSANNSPISKTFASSQSSERSVDAKSEVNSNNQNSNHTDSNNQRVNDILEGTNTSTSVSHLVDVPVNLNTDITDNQEVEKIPQQSNEEQENEILQNIPTLVPKIPKLLPKEDNIDSSIIFQHQKTKSTANLIHPVFNNIQSSSTSLDEAKTSTSAPKPSTVNLLPSDASIEMYRQNAKKTKDPIILFSFAKILIKSSISKNNNLTPKERSHYLDESLNALKKSSKLGCIEAQYYLGDAYSVGLFNKGKPELSKSLSYFESAGKAKHAESAYRTAICYKKGWGCTRDARKVLKYLEIAAINNHPVAMMEYGIYAFHGLMSFPEDINTKKRGISWLRRATECATELSCGAPYELALIYLNGFKDIVIKDLKYAIKLLFQASNLGHAKSASLLGKFYEIGDIVEQNSDISIHFYNLSANLGDVDGMMGLCSWYFVGTENLPQDYDESFSWALEAAETHHHVKAMLLLEKFYNMGVGCDKDPEKAKYWGDLARSQKK